MILAWAFARLDARAFVFASAAVFAVVIFALTAAIVWKGAPPGVAIGPHLAGLAAYFPGYSVSIAGAFVGAAYGAALGAVWGFVLATLWNFSHALLLAVIRFRSDLTSYSID